MYNIVSPSPSINTVGKRFSLWVAELKITFLDNDIIISISQ